MSCRDTERAAWGANGTPGAAAPDGLDAIAGNQSPVIVSALKYSDLGDSIPPSLISMILHRADLAYLNGDVARASTDYSWVSDVSDEMCIVRPAPPDLASWRAARDECHARLNQLRLGLDFYGLPYNSVPLVALERYRSSVDAMLESANAIESEYNRYWAAQDELEAKIQSLESTLALSDTNLLHLREEVANLRAAALSSQSTVEVLRDSVDSQRVSLVDKAHDFQDAIERHHNCHLDEILKGVQTIVGFVRAAYGDSSGVIAAISAQSSSSGDHSLDGTLKTITTCAANIEDLRKQYLAVQHLIGDNPDAAKILTDREDFDKVVASYEKSFEEIATEYKGLQAGRDYKAALDQYVATVDALNHKIFDMVANRTHADALESQAEQREIEAKQCRASLAATRDPTIAANVAFFGRLLTHSKATVIRALHSESRAFEYWALQTVPFRVDDRRMAAISAIRLDLEAREQLALSNRNRAMQTLSKIRVAFQAADEPSLFEQLRMHDRCEFSIPPTHQSFRALAAVTVQEVSLRLRGVRTADQRLYMRLIHHGRALVVSPDNKVHDFTHAPRTTLLIDELRADIAPSASLGGDPGVYAYLSPFALWSLELGDDGTGRSMNQGLDLRQVELIELEFNVRFLPFN